jgi:SOS-response transcriptional repressor LexA
LARRVLALFGLSSRDLAQHAQAGVEAGRPPACYLPLFAYQIPAGFPSPAEDYVEGSLDLNAYLVPDPGATTFVRVPDAALQGRGIRAGDLLVVNRGRAARSGRLVWVELAGQCLLRELHRQVFIKYPCKSVTRHRVPRRREGQPSQLLVWRT